MKNFNFLYCTQFDDVSNEGVYSQLCVFISTLLNKDLIVLPIGKYIREIVLMFYYIGSFVNDL